MIKLIKKNTKRRINERIVIMKQWIKIASILLLSFIFLGCGKPAIDTKSSEPAEEANSTEITIPTEPAKPTIIASTRTEGETEQDKDKIYDSDLIEQTVVKWATAYCDRDGNTLYELFNPNNIDEFYQMQNVLSAKDDSKILFGIKSPWPGKDNYDYCIDDNTAEITYYAISSDLHTYTWIEKLTIEGQNGIYYVSSEQMKKYNSVTTKSELLESIQGNFCCIGNGLNYSCIGLDDQLNKNALKDKTKLYKALFSPKAAAPYLLNLSGGNCVIKAQYETYTFVTYKFKNDESIDIQLSQPFGKDGIWLVKDVGVECLEDSYKRFADWYQNITIEDLSKIKTMVTINELSNLPDKDQYIILLASIPKNNIYLYGCSKGVILRNMDNYQFFDWSYLSPMGVLPRIGYADYDDDNQKEIAISLHTGTGTGVSIEQLYLVKSRKDGTMQATEFIPYQYTSQLNERVIGNYDINNDLLQFYIDGKKRGTAIDLSEMIKDNGSYSNISFDSHISFYFSNDEIMLGAIPTLYFANILYPEYEEMPSIDAKVVYKNNKFSLADFKYKDAID